METALISIIIPNYNRELLISDTLDSIVDQTYRNWECIIVDDGSTDSSFEIVERYCEKDNRFIQVIRPFDLAKGACSCRNYGFSLSKGTYINFFDSDDIMAPNKLEVQINRAINSNSDVVICQTAFFETNINNFKSYWNTYFTRTFDPLTDFITFRLAWSTNAPLWKKSFLDGNILFNIKLSSSQDWEFHVNQLINNPRLAFLENSLVFNRLHSNRIGNKKRKHTTRMKSRVIAFELLKENQKLSIEIKKYFKNYFLNQLKHIDENESYYIDTIIPIIKDCTNKMVWYCGLSLKITFFRMFYKYTGKKEFIFKHLIKQVINENRK